MTDQPARYRRTPADIEAVQWTGTNTDALRAFAGSDFDTIDPDDRIEDPDQDAQLLVEASHWVGIKPGDWVVKYEGYFVAKADATFRAVWESAAVSVPPSTDQTALRDRIAAVMREHYLCTNREEADADGNLPCRCGDWREPGAEVDDENDWDSHLADAVLAVLPAPDALTQARATNQRLNLRAQALESELAAYRRAVRQWEVSERGTYIPHSSLRVIGNACGVDVLGTVRHLKHFERVEQAEAVLDRIRQMADYWEQQLPEVIRTPAVVSAIRAALEPADELRRVAAEEQPAETRQSCACGQDGCEYCDADEAAGEQPAETETADRPAVLLEIATTLDGLAETDMIRKRRSLGTTRRLLAVELRRMAEEQTATEPAAEEQPAERPRCPHCQLPHDLTPDSLPAAVCASTRQRITDAAQAHTADDHSGCCRVDCDALQAAGEQPGLLPRRGDTVDTWLKTQRNEHRDDDGGQWSTLDQLLDLYRLHADTGTPLGQHVCEGRTVGDCGCMELHLTPSGNVRVDHLLRKPAAPVAGQPPADTRCLCGHTRGEHITVGGPFGRGRLLCDECNGLDGSACKEFEAL